MANLRVYLTSVPREFWVVSGAGVYTHADFRSAISVPLEVAHLMWLVAGERFNDLDPALPCSWHFDCRPGDWVESFPPDLPCEVSPRVSPDCPDAQVTIDRRALKVKGQYGVRCWHIDAPNHDVSGTRYPQPRFWVDGKEYAAAPALAAALRGENVETDFGGSNRHDHYEVQGLIIARMNDGQIALRTTSHGLVTITAEHGQQLAARIYADHFEKRFLSTTFPTRRHPA